MISLSKLKKVKGTIKAQPSDFIVKEITLNGIVLELDKNYSNADLGLESKEGKFVIFVMQKENWNTIQALREIAKAQGRGIKSVGFAGTKDRRTVSVQLCSIFGASPEKILSTHIKDIKINGAWPSDKEVKMGDLLGNRFAISVNTDIKNSYIENVLTDLKGFFPNYFGAQRFGTRNNNIDVGIKLLKQDYEGAVREFLTNTTNEHNLDAIEARERLSNEWNFSKALEYFPKYLKYERMIINYLSKYPRNYANAILKLPRSLSLMFIHSVESYIFNRELEILLENSHIMPQKGDKVCGKNSYGFPNLSDIKILSESDKLEDFFLVGNIVGYDTKSITDTEKSIMEELDINEEMFKLKGIPPLSCKGSHRVLFAPFKDFAYEEASSRFSFSLPAGAYATVLLNEFIEE
ncbi:MAG: tRNA pseudouridine(13) synthase TruD [Candidatus Micrarchaeia archaeon]